MCRGRISRGFALIYGLQHCVNDVIDSLECFLQLCRILAACGCAVRTTAAAAANDLGNFLDDLAGVCALLDGLSAADTKQAYLVAVDCGENSNCLLYTSDAADE